MEVEFRPEGAAATTVTITQVGFERLGEAGPSRRERTGNAWATIAERFAAAAGS